MDRTSIRAWRRIQEQRVWRNRLRFIFRVFCLIFVQNVDGRLREPNSWKELRKVKWCQVYRSTGQPCSCERCRGERYNRQAYKRDTVRIMREQAED